jgi:predicted metal-binding protein
MGRGVQSSRNRMHDDYIARMAKQSLLTARLRRTSPVLVCRKCLGRIDDGKALRKSLKSDLKRRSADQGIKGPRVLLTDCMGICPKSAVVVASGATLQRNEYLLLRDAGATTEAAVTLLPGNKSPPD